MNTNALKTPNQGNSNKLFVFATIGVIVIGIAAVAFLVTQDSSSAPTTNASGEELAPTADVEITGEHLQQIPTEGDAPTIDVKAPTLTGTDLNGERFKIGPNGTPKAIYFLAHWCSHCQAEVPQVQELIDDGQKPDNLEIVAVSTGVDEGRGNFPPSAWLNSEGFTPLTMRDNAASEALTAFGGTGFPFVVYLDGENNVIRRTIGPIDAVTTVQYWEEAAQR